MCHPPCGLDISGTGFLTTYSYDALSNLLTVAQNGLSQRSFGYDFVSRLTNASNPESGNIAYTYDSDSACPPPPPGILFTGLLASKLDARNIKICFQYDQLHRVTQKSYSDTTPTATFNFDQSSANGVSLLYPTGRLTSQSTASPNPTGEVFSYDQMGRATNNSQCTPQNCGTAVFPLQYSYDLAGDPVTGTNGTGVTLTYTVNTGTRLTSLTSSLSDSNHPGTLLSSAHYNAAGALLSASLGSGVAETRTYDARLRLASIADGANYTLAIPSSGGYAPNSNILRANDSANGNWVYGYDDFNRIATGVSSGTGQGCAWAYDQYGNRWSQATYNGSCTQTSLSFSGGNNQIDSEMGTFTYDAAGNLTHDGIHYYFFDAENRLIQVDGTLGNCSSATACYLYNASGQRVRKTVGATSVDYLYDLSGQQITELSSTGGWNRGEVHAGSRHLATYSGGTSGATYFINADWLGTERVRTDKSGNTYETCVSLPFGDGLSCSGGDPSPMHFTGKQRDTDSGLDNFEARYTSSSLGRFMSPDPNSAGAEPGDPQTWNAYAYVTDNPVNGTDPDGRAPDQDDPCKGKNPGNCVAVKATPPPLPGLIWVRFAVAVTLAFMNGQAVRAALNSVGNSGGNQGGNSGCVTAFTVAGAAAGAAHGAEVGAAGGTLGFAGGPVGVATVGGGAVGGALVGGAAGGAAGFSVGQVACSSGSAGGGGGGGGGGSGAGSSENETADKIISESKQGGIRREFPSQFLDKTLGQIRDEARSGDAVARKALKLLTDSRFNK